MKISIITTSKNSERFIHHTAKSILYDQDYKNFEWIVVDGNSTDNTIKILKKFNSPRIKIFYENYGNHCKAWNLALKKTTGQIIGAIGADDVYEKNIFSKIVSTFKRYNCEWLFGLNSIINHEGKEIRKFITKFKKKKIINHNFQNLLKDNYIPFQSVFWKKSFFPNKIGYFDENEFINAMDYEVWLRMHKYSEPMIIKKKLSKFRVHSTSITARGSFSQFLKSADLAKKYGKLNFLEFYFYKFKAIILVIFYKILIKFI